MVEVRKYVDGQGRSPFDTWLRGLSDRALRARVQVRIERLALGLEGDWKGVGEGIRELRIPAGPGLRIYYAWDGPLLVLLLCGGDKSRQPDDIRKAKAYWRDYRGE
jgi:putative addiction module killer protein